LVKIAANKIRIKDIAALASVSTGTVDRVLHKRDGVAEETRKQILDIVENLEYTPNLVAKSLALKKTYRITVLIPDSKNDNPYWERPKHGIEQAYNEIKDFNSKVDLYTFNIGSEDSFIKSFDKMIRSEPDGIIFNPLFLNSSLAAIVKCEKKKIPYIFIDINIDGCNNLAYFGQDAFQSGYLAAKLMDYSLHQGSEILILKLTHHKGIDHHLIQREKGFLAYFKQINKIGNYKISSFELELSDEMQFRNILTDQSVNNPINKGIFVTNSRVYKVAEYLEQNKIGGNLLIGYDLIQKNIHYLEQGVISILIGQNPEEQGFRSVQAMFNFLLLGKAMKKINYSPIDIIFKENIHYYKNYKS
jgi:LacI family transcriptional regulator